MVQINNNYQRAIALLASQFRGDNPGGLPTNLQKLIRALVYPAQELEDVNYELLNERWLSTSIGDQLDEIGVILGLPRLINESDDDYRERLQFQIFINTSVGSPEDSIRVLQFFTQASHIGYIERPSAFYQMETNGTKFPIPPNQLNESIFSVSPAGVNYAPIVATYGVSIPFEFSGDLRLDPLGLNNNSIELNTLEVEPYASLLYVSAGNVEDGGPNGGLDELGYPLATAGQLSELIQINGNSPPRR
jgi:hypothetical protein